VLGPLGNLSRQGRCQDVRDNLRVKEVRVDDADGTRFILCHNPDQATRDQARRENDLVRIEAELARIADQRQRDRDRQFTDPAHKRVEQAHVKAECALRDHPSLGRWIRQTPKGRLAIDRAKVKAEERLDGKYLLATCGPDLTAEDAALGYKNLLEAQRGFRDMKSELLLRPVFHRLEHRIRGHVLLRWLALLLIRVAERRSGQTWRTVRRQTGRIMQITLSGPAGTVTKTQPSAQPSRPPTRAFPSNHPPGSPPSTPPDHPATSPARAGQGVDTRPHPALHAFPQVNTVISDFV